MANDILPSWLDHVQKNILIPVNQPPVFVTVPESQDVTEGDGVDLQCKATGKPIPQIIWYKDGQVCNEDDHVRLLGAEDDEGMGCECKLSLNDIIPASHSGKYTIEAVNAVGKTSHSITLSGNGTYNIVV